MNSRKILADAFIDRLDEQGLKFMKGWSEKPLPYNLSTGATYQGANLLFLMADDRKYSAYITFIQLQELAKKNGKRYKIKQGSKSTKIARLVNRMNTTEVQDDDDVVAVEREIKVMKMYDVFNVDDIEGLPQDLYKEPPTTFRLDALERAMKYWHENAFGPSLRWGWDQAYYSQSKHEIVLPHKYLFKNESEMILAILHEASHATGHVDLLDRFCDKNYNMKTENYAEEEGVAHLSCMQLCALAGVELTDEFLDSNQAYLNGWKKRWRDEPTALYSVISKAQKSADYLEEVLFNSFVNRPKVNFAAALNTLKM